MTLSPFDNFLISLAVALAAQASPAVNVAQGELQIHQANEKYVHADLEAYAVLRCYGGPVPEMYPGAFEEDRPQTRSLQLMAYGKVSSGSPAMAASALANRLWDALYDTGKNPRNHWAITPKTFNASLAVANASDGLGGWEVRLITPTQPPAQLGTDAQNRVQVVFNFDITFERKSA